MRSPCFIGSAFGIVFCALAMELPANASVRTAPLEGYVGAKTCAPCHAKQFQQQSASNHASTWLPPSALSTRALPQGLSEESISYRIDRVNGKWGFRVTLPRRPRQIVPVHSVVGGRRFGISFILEANQIESRTLSRAALVEARYMLEAGSDQLKLSPGFPTQTPHSYDTALGRVLSPQFAQKCMDCHGGIRKFNESSSTLTGNPDSLTQILHPQYMDTGVRCERCHGPGAAHVTAMRAGAKEMHIVHPGRLSNRELMGLCGNCHSGFFPIAQPRPQDLLISSQVTALSQSECYIQSKAGFSCISCHDPHVDARHDEPIYQATCLSCHSAQKAGAVSCPANSESGCISCHMPVVTKPGNFKLTDHWIRIVSTR